MKNYSQVSYFNLTAYFDTGTLKYMYFILVLSLYLSVIAANVLLIVLICVNRSLHEPMYLFLCSLFVNELYGSTGLFPLLLFQILKDIHTISASFCFLQIYNIHTYACVEFIILAVMSYDRYLAICYPLQYNQRMTSHKVFLLIVLSWLCSFILVVILILLSAPLQRCGNIIHKVYCDNYSIVKLACSDTTVNNIYGLIITVIAIFGPFIFILYTYMRILKVCFSGSKQTRHKAVSTCTPHLASVINYCFGAFFEVIQSRFNMNNVHNTLKIFLSIYWLTCQPLFNPLMYGLNMSKIRIICKNLLR
ncbi:olfactory receptor 11A1-like [Sphaeramia orbicularis]|uniref:olfactory receptor 11A1-like n=1 Tax=Sphaeramia orbicularis TaxID=375764 RepID=UPI0011804BF4|nr:olfactory receptor 11A1-like [Sphaeramia orbicularis]